MSSASCSEGVLDHRMPGWCKSSTFGLNGRLTMHFSGFFRGFIPSVYRAPVSGKG